MTRSATKRWLPLALASAVALLLAAVFAAKTGLVSGGWYSADLNYRYQTTGFLHGSLRVQPSPIKHLHDWAWSDGMHQIWGLGAPLLRLPFDALAAPFGVGFPDRLVFLFYYALTALVVFTAPLGGATVATRVAITILVLANPAWQTLVGGTNFPVYEEAIAYNALWATLVLFLALRALEPGVRAQRFFLLASALAGCAGLFRPTGLLYGALSFGLMLWKAPKLSQNRKLTGLALFFGGWLLTAATNAARFGTPLSFGHDVSMSNAWGISYALRFGYPFQKVSWFEAAREELGYLFSAPLGEAWRSGLYRYRNVEIPLHFGWLLVVYLLTLAGLAARAAGRAKRRAEKPDLGFGLALWSTVAFATLFVFYARIDWMITRYHGDFFPAVYVGLAAGLLALVKSCPRKWANALAATAAVAAAVWALATPIPGTRHPTNITSEQSLKQLPGWETRVPELPDEYFCKMPNPHRGIGYNTQGWELQDDCSVHETIFLFFRRPECVTLGYEGAPGGRIRVLDQHEELVQTSANSKGATTEVKFCHRATAGATTEPREPTIRLFSIGLIDPQDLSRIRKPSMRLLFARRSER